MSEFDEDTTDSSLGLRVLQWEDGHGGVGSLLCGGKRDVYRLVDRYKRYIYIYLELFSSLLCIMV